MSLSPGRDGTGTPGDKIEKLPFNSIMNMITENRTFDLNVIITGTEKALINTIMKYFPNTQTIAYFFHYNKNI